MKLRLQEGVDPLTKKTIYLVLDKNYQIVKPIQMYLTYLSADKSPNTVKSYGNDLKHWYEFLDAKHLDWREVCLSDLDDFGYWLRVGEIPKVIPIQPVQAIRTETTVNHAITVVSNFYDYHIANKTVDFKHFHRFDLAYGISKGKSLRAIAKSNYVRTNLIRYKKKKNFPGCLTDEQITNLVSLNKRLRDKLMILMFNSTGMRKGELLGLKHEDIGDINDNFIRVVKRDDDPSDIRVKGKQRTIPVPSELLRMYQRYLIDEYPLVESDYVFVNIWGGKIGTYIKPRTVNTMFERLARKSGIKLYPHLFRHTYATRLILSGYSLDRVKYLLGHENIQTTLDTYSHIIEKMQSLKVVNKEEDEDKD